MSGQEVLREFLVNVNFQSNEKSRKELDLDIGKLLKGLLGLASAAEAAAIALVASLGKMAESFERAYYQASRSGSAVKELNAFRYAASQTGSTAEEAAAAVDGLAQKIRENRGFRNLVQSITGDKSNDIVKQIRELGPAFAKMSSEQAHATAAMLGVPEHLLLALQDPKFEKFYAQNIEKTNLLGVDLEKAAEDGQKLTRRLRDVRDTISLIVDTADSPLFQQLDKPLQNLNAFLIDHGKEIADILGRIAGALVRLLTETLKLLPEADKLASAMGGWTAVFAGLAAVVSVTMVARMASLFGSLRALSLLAVPPWLKAILGVSIATDLGVPNKDKPGMVRRWDDGAGGLPGDLSNSDMDEADRRAGLKGRRGFMGRLGRMFGRKSGGDSSPVAPPTTPGTYRPQYKMSDADLSDAVVNVIAGEARANDQQGVDAVINTMFNRLGTKAYGPSGNLQQVATAPGQFAGYRRANGREAEYIRSRIRAIASGGVVDNTHGSNEFRTSTYGGPWMRNHPEAVGIGGNSFARNPSAGDAPYAPYSKPRIATKTPPMLRPGAHAGGQVPVPAIKGIYPGEGDHPAFNPSLAAPPLGSHSTDNSRAVTVIDQSKTTVNGVSDPQKAADHIGRIGDRQSSLLLRNLQSAVG